MEDEEASLSTEMLAMSEGLTALKSDAVITVPSSTYRGSVPELMELVPLMVIFTGSLGSPELAMTVRPATCPWSAWSKAAVGASASFSELTVATDPATVPFLRTP